jgi:hypothetical protein
MINVEYDKNGNQVRSQDARAMFCLSLQLLIRLVIILQGEEGVIYDGTYVPLWQIQPAISEFESPYNWDHTSIPLFRDKSEE